MKGTMILATLAATFAGMAATALPAHAAVGSATLVGHTATLTLDGADDNVTRVRVRRAAGSRSDDRRAEQRLGLGQREGR